MNEAKADASAFAAAKRVPGSDASPIPESRRDEGKRRMESFPCRLKGGNIIAQGNALGTSVSIY